MYVCMCIYTYIYVYIHIYIYRLSWWLKVSIPGSGRSFTHKTLRKAVKNHQRYIQTNTCNMGIIFSETLFKNGGIISPTHS